MPSSVEVHDPYFAISKDQGSEPVVVGSTIVGRSGCLYQVERLLQKKPGPFGCVYLATYVHPYHAAEPMLIVNDSVPETESTS